MKYVFISGPYTKPDPVQNTGKAMDIGSKLLDAGLRPFIPHICLFWDYKSPRPYKVWLEYDLDWLERCDALIRMPGESPGAEVEVARAKELGIPVYHSVEDLLKDAE